MEKTVRFILITLALGIASATVNHSALAKREVKLVGVEEGNNNEHLTSDIIGDSVIMGARGAGVATIYVNDGKAWKKQGDLLASDPNAARAAIPSYSHSVAIGAPHEFAAANFAIIGAPRHLHGGEDALAGKGGFGAAYIYLPPRRNEMERANKARCPRPDA
jgi:hypothetical protein